MTVKISLCTKSKKNARMMRRVLLKQSKIIKMVQRNKTSNISSNDKTSGFISKVSLSLIEKNYLAKHQILKSKWSRVILS